MPSTPHIIVVRDDVPQSKKRKRDDSTGPPGCAPEPAEPVESAEASDPANSANALTVLPQAKARRVYTSPRTPEACDDCRQRRMKCDAHAGGCTNCHKKGRTCSLAKKLLPHMTTIASNGPGLTRAPSPDETAPKLGPDGDLLTFAVRRVQHQSRRETGIDQQFIEEAIAAQVDQELDATPVQSDLAPQALRRGRGFRSLVADFPAIKVAIEPDRQELLRRPWRDGPQKPVRYGPKPKQRPSVAGEPDAEVTDGPQVEVTNEQEAKGIQEGGARATKVQKRADATSIRRARVRQQTKARLAAETAKEQGEE
ncbi:hypothetical protein MBLNU457_7839t1 [Dothideomycetes sp. NU457]